MGSPAKQLHTKSVPIDKVRPYHANAKIGDVDVIRESLRTNGMYRPIVVWAETNEILAGNHTWKACKAEGYDKITATFIECDAETATRINLVDNKAPELGSYDDEALIAALGSLPDLVGTGYSNDEMQKLLDKLGPAPDIEPDDVPDDDYGSQLGVIVIVRDSEQQQTVFERLQERIRSDPEFADAMLKVVAV